MPELPEVETVRRGLERWAVGRTIVGILEQYQRAIKIDPALGDDVYFKLGNIRFKWQEKEQALAYWERSLALNPANEILRTNLELARTKAS